MTRYVNPVPQYLDSKGKELSGGKLYFYDSGSATKKKIWSDPVFSVQLPNPVTLYGDGRIPSIFLKGSYRVVLTDADGQQIWERDPVSGTTDAQFGADWSSIVTYDAGDVVREGDSYWISLTGGNTNNRPSTDGGANWEEIVFYQTGDLVGSLENYAAVRALNGSNFAQVSVAGRDSDGDGGGGVFVKISSGADNGRDVLVDAGGQAWGRVYAGRPITSWDENGTVLDGDFVPSGEYYVDIDDIELGSLVGDGFITIGGNRVHLSDYQGERAQLAAMEPLLGFNNGTTDTQIFANAERTPQGVAIVNTNGVKKLYVMQRTVSDTWLNTERHRIVEFDYETDGSVVANNLYTNELNIGHQIISPIIDSGQLYFYSGFTATVSHEGDDAGKGYSKIEWNGASTDQADVTNYQLFGYIGSGHIFEYYKQASCCVSPDGKYVILSASLDRGNGIDDSGRHMFIYDRAEVEAADDPLDVMPLTVWPYTLPNGGDESFVQGLVADHKRIYVLSGYTPAFNRNVVQVFDYLGAKVGELSADLTLGDYSLSDMLDNSILGTPVSFEPEGLAIDGDDIVCITTDNWRVTGDVVSFLGKNWASVTESNTGNAPTDGRNWVETTKTAGGAWSSGTTYNVGTNYTRRSKIIHAIQPVDDSGNQSPLSSGKARVYPTASIVTGDNGRDVSYFENTNWQVSAYYPQLNEYRNAFDYENNRRLRLFDARITADNNDLFGSLSVSFSSGREIMEYRAKDTQSSGAWANAYGGGDSTHPNKWLFGGGGSSSAVLSIGPDQIAFFTSMPVSKQTSVPVTAAGIHAALVNYGLIT